MGFVGSSKVSFLLAVKVISESFPFAVEFLFVPACVPLTPPCHESRWVAGTRRQTDGIADSEANHDTGGGLGGVRCKHAWLDELLSKGNAVVGQPIQWRCRGPLAPPGPVKHKNPKIANAVASRNVNIRASFIPASAVRAARGLTLRGTSRVTGCS
jgi:hypothetical protein